MAEVEQVEQEEKEGEGKGESSTPKTPQVGTRFSAEEIHDNVSEAAKEELERPASELVWSSIASGLLLLQGADENFFLYMAQPPQRVAARVATATCRAFH